VYEEYEDFFYITMPWENMTLDKDMSDEYILDSENSMYILPEFWLNQEVTLTEAFSSGIQGFEYPYSSYRL